MGQQALPLRGGTGAVRWIAVSPEMTALLGGCAAEAPLPSSPVWIAYSFATPESPATVRFSLEPGDGDLVLAVARDALLRHGGRAPGNADGRGYYLPSDLHAIALAFRDCPMTGEPRAVYRLAKSLELFCETVRLLRAAALVPLAPGGCLSFADTRRLHDARRMIDERWHEKLTLATIARGCGLNRAKLTQGFRALFACSIAEALAERRLVHASKMLLATDLPVSSIGYENGYLNNASFARAFSRRFGRSPSEYRAARIAA